MQIKDSQGNILTEQQAQYFQDSKVRDSAGNLLVCYHGTDFSFDTFDYEHMNPDSKLGLGFYFTKGDELKFDYEHEMACYINIMKPLYEYKDSDKLAEVLQEEERLLSEGKTKNEVISEIVAKFDIDGIIGDDGGHKCVVAFNSGQIKSVTNKRPTNRESINEEFLDSERTVFATKNEYEAKNLLSRNDKAYRILYDKKQKLYLIGDTDNVIHMDMIEMAIDSGYFIGMKRYEIPEYMDDAPYEDKAVIAIYTPNRLIKETNGADLGEDGYDDLYVYDDFVITTRDSNWKICPLSNTLGRCKKHLTFGSWTQDQWGNDTRDIIEIDESLYESYLIEKKRQELINKSRKGREYSKKNQARGKNRWERRRYSQVANSVRDYNSIDMNAFFKGDILDFRIKIKGETDDYIVAVTFEHILNNLQQEVKANNNKLEFKCVLRALLRSFNGEDVYINCSCPDFVYRFAHNATKGQYNSGAPEIRPNRFDWTNSKDDMGAACKHVNLVLSNTDWMMKIASVINNYIKWTRENMTRNYADIIFPAVYGMKYDKAVQLSLFDDPDDNGYLLPDIKMIFNTETGRYEFDDAEAQKKLGDIIDDTALKGRDEKGRWAQGNEYRFKKKDTIKAKQYPEDNPNQLHLDLDTIKKKKLKLDDEGDE